MNNPRLCAVCRRRPPVGLILCRTCGQDFDRATGRDSGTVMDVVEWAAGRAWRFASSEQTGECARTLETPRQRGPGQTGRSVCDARCVGGCGVPLRSYATHPTYPHPRLPRCEDWACDGSGPAHRGQR